MDHEVLLAIIIKKVEERLKSVSASIPRGPRGQRGARGHDGADGKDFDLKEHEEVLRGYAKDAAIKLEDLSPEEIEKLRGPRGRDGHDGKSIEFSEHEETIKSWAKDFALKFEDLSAEQLEKLRGPRGRDGSDGRDGKDFDFSEHEKTIKDWVEGFALKFDDFTEEQIEKLRGPRGRDGEDGKDFDFDANRESITEIVSGLIGEIKDSLKLKFNDLSAEEIEQIRGPRGRDGRDGKNFDFEEHKDFFLSLKPKFSEFTDKEKAEITLKFSHLTDEEKAGLKLRFEDLSEEDRIKIKGARGARGQRGQAGRDGVDGKDGLSIRGLPGPIGPRGYAGRNGRDGEDGEDGEDGLDAPYIVEIGIDQYKEGEFQFIFEFSDGSVLRSDPVKLPRANVYNSVGGGGLGSGGGGDDAGLFQGFSARFNEAFDTDGARETLLQILDFSYLAPLITLSSPVSTAIREKGTVVASVQLNALTTKRSDPITNVEFYKNGILENTVASPDPNGTTETYTDAVGFSDTTTYFARVYDGTSMTQSNTLTYLEVYPYYYGVGAPALSAAGVGALTKDIIANTATVARAFSPVAQVYYFAYPAAYPALTSILDNSGFETIADWTVRIEDITGLDATPVSYRIYEFNNVTTQTGFINTFKQ